MHNGLQLNGRKGGIGPRGEIKNQEFQRHVRRHDAGKRHVPVAAEGGGNKGAAGGFVD